MIERSYDGKLLNYLVNHETIRPDVGGDGRSRIDFGRHVDCDWHYFLKGDHGGFFCFWTAPATYEIHTLILPEGRGPWAFEFAREGRDFMQAQGAFHLWTRVPRTARHVRLFTIKAGFRPCGEQTLNLAGGEACYDLFDWRCECPQPS